MIISRTPREIPCSLAHESDVGTCVVFTVKLAVNLTGPFQGIEGDNTVDNNTETTTTTTDARTCDTMTIGRQALYLGGDLEQIIGSLAGVLAAAQDTNEKIARETRPLLDELATLAPTIARIAVLLERIDEAQTDIEAEDPREIAYSSPVASLAAAE